ncbi:MAG: response regulator [Clostridiales bacterium]|nr:response regulator [Clostridiales bacterium]
MEQIRVIFLEDDADFSFLVKKAIERDCDLSFDGTADAAKAGISLAKKLRPDVALIDLNLADGELTGIKAAHDIRTSTNAKVLLFTSVEREDVVISAGKKAYASGYIKKSSLRSLTTRIKECFHSITPEALYIKTLLLSELTNAERDVLRLLTANEDVFFRSSPKTIANQKTSIYRKLGVRDQHELMRVVRNF